MPPPGLALNQGGRARMSKGALTRTSALLFPHAPGATCLPRCGQRSTRQQGGRVLTGGSLNQQSLGAHLGLARSQGGQHPCPQGAKIQ